jgi:hypothetical protein
VGVADTGEAGGVPMGVEIWSNAQRGHYATLVPVSVFVRSFRSASRNCGKGGSISSSTAANHRCFHFQRDSTAKLTLPP